MSLNTKDPPWLLEQTLEVLAEGDRLHHALLVSGPSGAGQRELALGIAFARLCERRSAGGLACGACSACGWLAQGHHPDFRWVRPEADQAVAPTESGARPGKAPRASKEIVIDQIRDLGAFVALVSHRGAERVVMIDPAEAMNTAAANALLKTLEEPPPAVRFILTSDRVDRLPATVRSRCRPVPVRLPPREAIERWLRSHTDAPESTIDAALAAAGGAPIEALSLLTGSGAQVREQIAAALAEIPDSDPLEIADRLSGHDPGPVFRTLHAWLVDLSRLLMGAQPIHFISWSARLIQLMDRTDASVLGRFEGALLQQLRWAEHPLNARLFIEDTLIGYRSVFKTAGTAPASDRHSRGHDRGHEVTRGGAPRKIG